ncbi:tetratricopeptide repeat protein [Anatilimnocola floriformis]|uniref:tetratricopeptide repeat protein n=1 Tax=Anatilimnocola floriformis TaxID=2948575 RepID=UPI0020C465A0|nr:tetratricopeptide repeat protein [Anatilimnocola floriformis]
MTAHAPHSPSHSGPQGHADGHAQPGKLRQLLGAPGRLISAARHSPVKVGVPLALSVVAIIGALGVATLFFFGGEEEKITATKILAPLDDHEYATAREQATKLRAEKDLDESLQAACLYVLGSIVASEAEESTQPTNRRLLNLIAARYLDQSRQIAFPKGREPQGLLTLGRCFYRAGRFAQAVPILNDALAKNPDSAIEIEQELTDCYLKTTPPQPKQALVHNARLLQLPNLSPREKDAANLLAANIYFTANDLASCEQALRQIVDTSSAFPEAQALAARVQLQRLPKPQPGQKLTAAEQQPLQTLLAELLPYAERKGLEPAVAAQLNLLLAECHERLGQTREATALFAKLRKAHHGSPEAVAATFFEADWLANGGQVEESLRLYRRGLQEAGPAEAYDNRWLGKTEMQNRLGVTIRRYQDLKSFAEALELAEAAAAIIPVAQTLQWRADIERNWSADFVAQIAGRSRTEQVQLQHQARAHLREAANYDRELAKERIATRFYPDDLLRAASTFLQGHGYQQAEETFREFLRQQTRSGQPEALVGLGQALVALGRTSEAMPVLTQVQQLYEKHPASFQSRLYAATALQEKGDLVAAREMLSTNLFGSALTPQSAEWRDSLFLLGRIQFQQGIEHDARSRNVPPQETEEKRASEGLREMELAAAHFEEAVKTLTEASQRFPNAQQTIIANYEVAEAYRRAARFPRHRLDIVTIDSTRQALNRQLQNDLTSAVSEYTRLIEKLADDKESQRASVDLKILRNCYFNRADALFDLGRLEEAIQAYSAATNRYQHEPEALEAYVQIATCYRRLQRYSEARGTLQQARVVLERIKPDANFAATTRFDRQQWSQLLEWYSGL